MTKYWCVKFDDPACLKHGIQKKLWMMQYQYADDHGNDYQGNKKPAIRMNWERLGKIKPGHWFVAYLTHNTFFAIGKVITPRRPQTPHDSYAPLFYHVNDIAWPVNLIGFDNARVVRRSSYYVQQMLASHRPDAILPTRVEPAAASKDSELFALAGLDQPSGEIILKIVNRAAAPRAVTIRIVGGAPAGKARLITLHHDEPTAENSLDDPEVVVPWGQRLEDPQEHRVRNPQRRVRRRLLSCVAFPH